MPAPRHEETYYAGWFAMPEQQHALVIGGSMAGLLAARVLTDHFERVTVVERDRLPTEPIARKGLPQARHVHLLLARGRDILEQLFPGLESDLLVQGACQVDVIADVKWFGPTGWAGRFPSGITTPACTRDLLDWTIRRRLTTSSKVRFCDEVEVISLASNADRTRVTGVHVRSRHTILDTETLHADLVVDASGRGSKAPQWLQILGYPIPSETTISAFIGYASRIYARPASSSFEGLLMQPAPPSHIRGGALFPLEGDRWIVTLAGAARDYPPIDDEGFLAFAKSLRNPLLYETIKDATALSPIVGNRSTENRLRHYEHLARQPAGFVLLGDSVCALNPVYGQGMTAAAIGALALDRTLRRYGRQRPDGDHNNLVRHFQKGLAEVNKPTWLLATGEDFRYPQTVGGQRTLLTKLTHAYVDRIIQRATQDATVYKRMAEVIHLLKPPTSLVTPRILAATFVARDSTAVQ